MLIITTRPCAGGGAGLMTSFGPEPQAATVMTSNHRSTSEACAEAGVPPEVTNGNWSYARVVRAILLLAVACSGKTEQAPPPKPVIADAALDVIPVDAEVPFAITERKEPHETFVDVQPRDAKCPSIDYRRLAKTIRFERCRDKPFTKQLEVLRDMVAYLRSTEAGFDDVKLVGSADYYRYPEFAKRLVAYAQRVPYDRKVGLHKYTVEAASKEDMLPELAVIFQRKVKLSSVEKCSSGTPNGRGEIAEFLRDAGATGTAEYPVGCTMAWFELSR